MSELDQKPFDGTEFPDNPEPRCPCALILDTSGSMAGQKIAQLNAGLQTLAQELQADSIAATRVAIAVMTFVPVQVVQGFTTADAFAAPTLRASGDTPMGAAIQSTLSLLTERKSAYKANGIMLYYRPWVFLITDGAPTDNVNAAAAAVREAEASKSLLFYAVGVEGANMDQLKVVSVRQPLHLRGLSFRELFVWLSNSLGTVARSKMDETVPLTNPTAPDGWAIAN